MNIPRQPVQSRILDLNGLLTLVNLWKNSGDEIVFTNGCFDILHAGHISYLEKAAGLGTRLIIGVNDDASVSKLKGPTRPINILDSRMYLLASLSFVDAVVPFSEDTPLNLIKAIKPDILVKGGDYTPESVVGAEDIDDWGGSVVILPFVEGYSTTKVESKILSLHDSKKKDDGNHS